MLSRIRTEEALGGIDAYQASDRNCDVHLPDKGFGTAQHKCLVCDRGNVSVTKGRDGNQAEIESVKRTGTSQTGYSSIR